MKEIDGWVKIKKYTEDDGNPVCGDCPIWNQGEDYCEFEKDKKVNCNLASPGSSCPVWHGESKSEDPEILHRAEDWECAMKYLDDLGAPTEDEGGNVFSIIGRIARIPVKGESREVKDNE